MVKEYDLMFDDWAELRLSVDLETGSGSIT